MSAEKKSAPQGYKPQLSFGNFGQHIVEANYYLNVPLGIIALITGAVNQRYVDMAAGIYTLLITVVLYIWGIVRSFNSALKEEDKTRNVLEDMEWPKFVRLPLNIAQNYLLQALCCVVIAIFQCFCHQTALCGVCHVLAAFMFFVGFCRGEKPKPITGIKA